MSNRAVVSDRVTLTDAQREILTRAQESFNASRQRLDLVIATILAGAEVEGRQVQRLEGNDLILAPENQETEEE